MQHYPEVHDLLDATDYGVVDEPDRVIKVRDWEPPTRPAPGYFTVPDYDEVLVKLPREELERVRNFTIGNDHGEILFEGETDLVDVDLAKEVRIKPRTVDIYPDNVERAEGKERPNVIGTKLNRPAIVTLKGGVKPKANSEQSQLTMEEYEQALRLKVESHGGEHMYYDPEKFYWVFKVPYF